MKKSEVIQLDVELNTKNLTASVSNANRLLEMLGNTAKDVGNTMEDVLCIDTNSLEGLLTGINTMAQDLGTVADKMGEIAELLKPQEGNLVTDIADGFQGIVDGIDVFNTISDGRANLETLSEAIRKGKKAASDHGEDFSLLKALIPETLELGNLPKSKTDSSNVGTFTTMIAGLSETVSDAGQKFRDLGSAIGTAFGNIGTTIAQVAISTGTWIANTAAKVANTAAQWAQIAATTAWQAICTAATAVTTAFGAAMNFLTSPIGWVVLAVAALIAIIVALIANWDAVKEVAAKAWESITQTVEKVTNFLLEKLNGFNEFLQGAFAKDWTEQFGAFGSVLNAFFANFENVWNAVKGIFDGMIGFVKNVFAGNWGAAWESIVGVFKGIWDYLVAVVKAPINAIIALINGLVQGVVDGINTVIGMLNGFKVEIPDWGIFGDYAGETLGFNIATIKAPQIPYLAQGAVLPANKPFLAMVGDQKHGTNVEAPLATIQEAVALVMEDMVASNMAGHEATVAALRQILQAVMGIRVGDEVLGRAVDRYHSKMAVIHGGM